MTKAGVLVKSLRLRPSSDAKRLVFTNNEMRVIDGPFAESKELIGGFAVMELSGMDEVLEMCQRYAEILGGTLGDRRSPRRPRRPRVKPPSRRRRLSVFGHARVNVLRQAESASIKLDLGQVGPTRFGFAVEFCSICPHSLVGRLAGPRRSHENGQKHGGRSRRVCRHRERGRVRGLVGEQS